MLPGDRDKLVGTERLQPHGLGGVLQPEAGAGGGVHHVLERHVDGEVLLTGRRERLAAPPVVLVRAQPAIGPTGDELLRASRRSRSPRVVRATAGRASLHPLRDRHRHREGAPSGTTAPAATTLRFGRELADRGNHGLDQTIAVEPAPAPPPSRRQCVPRCGTGGCRGARWRARCRPAGQPGADRARSRSDPSRRPDSGTSSSARTTGPSASSNGSTVEQVAAA